MGPRRVNTSIKGRARPADRGWPAVPISRPQPDGKGVVQVRGRHRSAVRVARRKGALSAILWVRLGTEVGSCVFPAEGQTLHVHGSKLVASLIGTLRLDPLELIGLRMAVAEASCTRLGAGQAESGSTRILFDETGGGSEGSIPASLRGETGSFAARAGTEDEVCLTSRIFQLRLALGQGVFPFPGSAAIVGASTGTAATPAPQSRDPPASAIPRKARLPEGPN